MISGYGAAHGPLHFFIWNFFFSVLIKDSLPLTSQTIFIPNIVATWVLLIYAYLLGRQFFSKKFSYLFAAAVILSPWAAIAMRFPTFHALLTTLMHIATLYHYTVFIKEPDRPLNRFLAPFSLAIYLLAGLDWPFFLFIIVLYLAINQKLKAAIFNKYNLLPIAVMSVHIAFFLNLALTTDHTFGANRWRLLYFSYPFHRFLTTQGLSVIRDISNFQLI